MWFFSAPVSARFSCRAFCLGGGARPNARFQALCDLAGIKRRTNVETGRDEPWELKDLRKTCATYYDEHVPESSIEILGHSVGGITYRHYAHRASLAFKAIMRIPQPAAFLGFLKGFDAECPCCRRRFDEDRSMSMKPTYASLMSSGLQFRRKPPGRRRGQGRRKTRCGLKLVVS
jgi:hypothetical protein